MICIGAGRKDVSYHRANILRIWDLVLVTEIQMVKSTMELETVDEEDHEKEGRDSGSRH